MTREQAIDIIECLYPVDADFPDTRETGKQLLEQAKLDTEKWRNLPDAVILRYAYLCQKKESEIINKQIIELQEFIIFFQEKL